MWVSHIHAKARELLPRHRGGGHTEHSGWAHLHTDLSIGLSKGVNGHTFGSGTRTHREGVLVHQPTGAHPVGKDASTVATHFCY